MSSAASKPYLLVHPSVLQRFPYLFESLLSFSLNIRPSSAIPTDLITTPPPSTNQLGTKIIIRLETDINTKEEREKEAKR